MPKIIFLSDAEPPVIVEARSGTTLMEAAIYNGVDGIAADCGGACSCATCKVIVDRDWRERVGPQGADEAEMLSETRLPPDGLRLSCQIVITGEMDGLTVRVPDQAE